MVDVYTFSMKKKQSQGHRRINITLPENTLQLMDRVTAKGDRSRFIAEALQRYLGEMNRKELRKQVQEGAIARAERDLKLAQEWFFIEEEAWEHRER